MAKKKSSTKKIIKKSTKKAVKELSKSKGGVVFLVIIAILLVGFIVFAVAAPVFDGQTLLQKLTARKDENTQHNHNASGTIHSDEFSGVVYDDFQIRFLELGNYYTGDSIYIKAGDKDILIDAGSRQSSAKTIKDYFTNNSLVGDNKFEYVIATHADQDHISGFVGTTTEPGIFYSYTIDNLIDFSFSNKSTAETSLYGKYVKARQYLVDNGTHAYTARQAYDSIRTVNLGTDMTMTFLYHKFYDEKSSDENNHSVVTLFTYKSQHYLLTGDLEKEGEESLLANNPDLPHCELYKAGHHGSKTSSSAALMAKITPNVVCVCCCCGSPEYTDIDANQFPTQTMINNVGIYTDNIFVTSIYNATLPDKFESMNGTILFSSNGTEYSVACSNNLTKLKDTDWFKAHRTWPSA